MYSIDMLWDVVLSRDRGRVIPRFDWGRLTAFRGRLIVEEGQVACLKRFSPVARLLPEPPSSRAPTELWDCKLIQLNNDYLVFSGSERIHEDWKEIDYAQTWFVKPEDESQPAVPRGGSEWI